MVEGMTPTQRATLERDFTLNDVQREVLREIGEGAGPMPEKDEQVQPRPWVNVQFNDVGPDMVAEIEAWAAANDRKVEEVIWDMAALYGTPAGRSSRQTGALGMPPDAGPDA